MRQNILDEIQCAGIVRLAQPEDSLLTNCAIAVGPGDFDEFRNAFTVRDLSQGEDASFFTSVSGSFSSEAAISLAIRAPAL